MTLPSSGSITIAQILNEIGDSYPVTIPNANWRTLAGKPTGSLVIPTDFYGKSAVAIVDTKGPTAHGTSHNFGTVNFGADGPSRKIVIYVFGQGKSAGVTPGSDNTGFTNFVAGGAANQFAPNGFFYRYNLTETDDFAGVNSSLFDPVGTSGNVSLTTGLSTRCSIVVLSILSPAGYFGGEGNDAGGFTNTVSTTTNVSSRGILVAGAIASTTAGLNMGGVTEQTQINHVGNYWCSVGFNTGLAAQTGRPVSATTTSGANSVVMAIEAESYS
ncbi:hypothetical protein [Mesorhizobium sp. B2-1-2]|uniref:hypothetical protein n=1 Tax=Mesorhizobium sp. B2-1-2 TaxID=2589973 RepID=UPI001129E80B|nr:hypothetical protein [Mesorhizobium sp. B2-1-2]TPN11729.1 hypothetical protein FJ971_10005 [Mesorhizobium sp. B2-1-2]